MSRLEVIANLLSVCFMLGKKSSLYPPHSVLFPLYARKKIKIKPSGEESGGATDGTMGGAIGGAMGGEPPIFGARVRPALNTFSCMHGPRKLLILF